jgi:pyrimidine operon attenuation protein / uracil phosphoribosyltransferase
MPRVLMDEAAMERALRRMAAEILERHPDLDALAFVGIRTRGVPLAERLSRQVAAAQERKVPVGSLDITLYRDDLTAIGPQAVLRETRIPFTIDGRRIVLVDDVLYTGRTIRAALDGLIDFGRPRSIELAVLVDRGHRELPIHADYVGKSVTTVLEEVVAVHLREIDGRDEVCLEPQVRRAPPSRARPAARPGKPHPSAGGRIPKARRKEG